MSSPKYASPLTIDIVPSRIVTGTVLLVHLGALLLLVPLQLPLLVKIVLSPAIAMSAAVSMYYCGRGPRWALLYKLTGGKCPRFISAVWDNNDQWQLTDERGDVYLATLLPTTLVHPAMVVLNLRLSGQPWYCRHRAVILLRDNTDPETFRRLRIRLRWYSPPVLDNSAASK